MSKETELKLQLGDIIKILDNNNESLNQYEFYIDYIDNSSITLINTTNFENIELIIEDGIIQHETIEEIHLLSRSEKPGYAFQHELNPETWVNIYFEGDVPLIITGVIENLEEDMIQVKSLDNEVYFINFDYKGLPKDLPITRIERRNRPNIDDTHIENENDIVEEKEEDVEEDIEETIEEINKQQPDFDLLDVNKEISKIEEFTQEKSRKELQKEFVVNEGDIVFDKEFLKPIIQLKEIDESLQVYDLDEQIANMIDDYLSEIPTIDRKQSVLNNINIQVQRYKELRKEFLIEKKGKIVPDIKSSYYKPLINHLTNFENKLSWIIPITEFKKQINVKEERDEKIMEQDHESSINYYINNYMDDINDLQDEIELYKQNGNYYTLYENISEILRPYSNLPDEHKKNIVYEVRPKIDTHAFVVNNDDDDEYNKTTFFNNNLNNYSYYDNVYTLGLNKLQTYQSSYAGNYNVQQPLTEPELMSISNLLILPETMRKFSMVHLKSTNIMERSNISNFPFQLWNLFDNQKKIKNININLEIAEKEKEFIEKKLFSNSFKKITFKSNKIISKENFESLLNVCIPKTKIIFIQIQKYIDQCYSMQSIVKEMEPYMVYQRDITFFLYKKIEGLLRRKVKDYNKLYSTRGEYFNSFSINFRNENKYLKNLRNEFLIEDLISEQESLRDFIKTDYNYYKKENITNDEFYREIIITDSGKLLCLTLQNDTKSLMFPLQFNELLKDDENNYKNKKNEEPEKGCDNVIISKRYDNIDSIKNDNNKSIYFDKKYDDTEYEIMTKYENDVVNMSPIDFKKFLLNKIKEENKGINENEALYLCETLINGHKKVLNGHYAIYYPKLATTRDEDNFIYYKRVNNEWERSELKDIGNINSSYDICNLTERCNYDVKDKCENIETTRYKLKENLVKDIMYDFDNKYHKSKNDLELELKENYEFYKNIYFPKLIKYNKSRYLDVNKQKNSLIHADKDNLVNVKSPYEGILNIIMKTPDFLEKQHLIIKFASKCLRTSLPIGKYNNDGKQESSRWLYCIKSDKPLLPMFKYEIACNYVENINNISEFNIFMEQLIAKIGKKSDNGAYWVDEESGRFLAFDDFDTDEGYDDSGFVIRSREIMNVNNTEAPIEKYTTKELKLMNTIISSMKKNMNITLNNQEFIMKLVTDISEKNIQTEVEYNDYVKSKAKKGLEIPTYDTYYYTSYLYFTLAALLIGIQTHIPNIKIKNKSVGVCKKTFKGYPFEGAGDYSGINFISCLVHKMKAPYDPWKVLLKSNENIISKKIKGAIDLLINENDVKQSILVKQEYLLANELSDDTLPEEYDVKKWKTFLPPLVKIEIKNVENVTESFTSDLYTSIRNSNIKQIKGILTLKTKEIELSFGIQKEIQNIIEKEDRIFQYMVTNACCSRQYDNNQINYFTSKSNSIIDYNKYSYNIEKILGDIENYSRATMLLSSVNSKMVYPSLNNNYDEYTIYSGYIKICNFQNDRGLDDSIIDICEEKPEYINKNDTINEMIYKMKKDDRNITEVLFKRLLKNIANKNLVTSISKHNEKNNTSLMLLTKYIDDKLNNSTNPNERLNELHQLLKSVVLTFDVGNNTITEETKKLNNYLSKENDKLVNKLKTFVFENIPTMTNKKKQEFTKCIDNISEWINKDENEENDVHFNKLLFYKDFIRNYSSVFPNIILNKCNYKNTKIPKHWNLSDFHMLEIKNIIDNYYSEFRSFYEVFDLTEICKEVKVMNKEITILSNLTPHYSTKKVDNKVTVTPIFDERTSEMLFKHFMLLSLESYIVSIDISTPKINPFVAKLIHVYISILCNNKKDINIDYRTVREKVYKQKQLEKNDIRDRLEDLDDEQRDIDTVLKNNKLGRYNAGLQKYLTTYNKKGYDEQKDFRERMNEDPDDSEFVMENDVLDDELELRGDDENDEIENSEHLEGLDLFDREEKINELVSDKYIEEEDNDMRNMPEDYQDGYDYSYEDYSDIEE